MLKRSTENRVGTAPRGRRSSSWGQDGYRSVYAGLRKAQTFRCERENRPGWVLNSFVHGE
jgi:hypothetical protein